MLPLSYSTSKLEAVVAALTKLSPNSLWTASSAKFSIGSLGENGRHLLKFMKVLLEVLFDKYASIRNTASLSQRTDRCEKRTAVIFERDGTSNLQGKLRLYDEFKKKLFVLSSSNRGRVLGIIDLMRQKNKRMKQEGLNRQIGKLQDVT
ncbi:hypothetical protein Tco_1245262 [Tanacetum coccineum]